MLSDLLTAAGLGFIALGLGLAYPPAGVVAAGAALALVGFGRVRGSK